MQGNSVYETAVEKLRKAHEEWKKDPETISKFLDAKGRGLKRFQPIFKPTHLPQLTAEEFQNFLKLEKNEQP